MPRALTQLVLFLSSYAPLFAIMAFLNSWGDDRLSIASGVIAVLSVAALVVFQRLATRLNPHQVRISAARPRDSDAIAYLLTYIVPFVSFVDPAPRLC